jgi:hypothetical protein
MEEKSQFNEEKTSTCKACDRELHLGDDCMAFQRGVMGPRGFVKLEEPKFLCDYVCAENHFDSNVHAVERRPRRVP